MKPLFAAIICALIGVLVYAVAELAAMRQRVVDSCVEWRTEQVETVWLMPVGDGQLIPIPTKENRRKCVSYGKPKKEAP